MKKIKRKIIAPLLFKSRIPELLAHFSKNSNLILNYHGVVNKLDTSISKNHLFLGDFEKQIKYFQKKFTILPIEEIIKKKTKSKTIGLTFDDGYLNNLTNALPILESLNAPATVFVTTQMFSRPGIPLWYDLLDISFSKIGWQKLSLLLATIAFKEFNLSDHNHYASLKNAVKKSNSDFKNLLVDQLMNMPEIKLLLQNTDFEYWNLMNQVELKKLSESKLIEIGSHGLTHSNLDELNIKDLNNELNISKELLSNACEKNISSIAFPDGAYNEDVKNLCRELGYKRMYAVNYRSEKDKSDNDIFPRLSISNTTTTTSILIQTNLAFNSDGF